MEEVQFRVSDLCCCAQFSPLLPPPVVVCVGELIAHLCREYLGQYSTNFGVVC